MDGTRKYAWPPGQYLTVLARSFFAPRHHLKTSQNTGHLAFGQKPGAPCLRQRHGKITVDRHQVLEAKFLGRAAAFEVRASGPLQLAPAGNPSTRDLQFLGAGKNGLPIAHRPFPFTIGHRQSVALSPRRRHAKVDRSKHGPEVEQRRHQDRRGHGSHLLSQSGEGFRLSLPGHAPRRPAGAQGGALRRSAHPPGMPCQRPHQVDPASRTATTAAPSRSSSCRPQQFKIEGVYLDPMVAKKLQVLLESGVEHPAGRAAGLRQDGAGPVDGASRWAWSSSSSTAGRWSRRPTSWRPSRCGPRRRGAAGDRLRQDRGADRPGGGLRRIRNAATWCSWTSSTAARRAPATR